MARGDRTMRAVERPGGAPGYYAQRVTRSRAAAFAGRTYPCNTTDKFGAAVGTEVRAKLRQGLESKQEDGLLLRFAVESADKKATVLGEGEVSALRAPNAARGGASHRLRRGGRSSPAAARALL
eukprot:404229-Prymnesium_polylepis.2